MSQSYLCQGSAFEQPPHKTGNPFKLAHMLIRIWHKLGMGQQQCYEMIMLWHDRHGIEENIDYIKILDEIFKEKKKPYSCHDEYMSAHCAGDKCALYDGTVGKHQVNDVFILYKELKEAIMTDDYEIANFNTLFPIIQYPFFKGEVMVFVGPEKIGKTSLMHNWFLSMKERQPRILNVHLEMDNKDEISRLIQVEAQLDVNYSENINQVAETIKNEYDYQALLESIQYIKFYNRSRYAGDIKNMITAEQYDIVYIDSFDAIQYKGKSINETFNQKDLIAEFQHAARLNNFLLIMTHHQNKMGDPKRITSNSISGVKEISYQANHVIALELADNGYKKLRAIASRRHSNLDFLLTGGGNKLLWQTAINATYTP